MSETLPHNLTVEALALSPAELRAYPRWYTDLLLRKRCETIAINDTFKFVDNFGITDADKDRIFRMLGSELSTLEPPQFYVFLRLTGHILEGRSLRRELAFLSAPVPKPRSILSKSAGRKRAIPGDTEPLPGPVAKASSNPFRRPQKSTSGGAPGDDIESFVTMMTGKPKRSSGHRAKKRVTFDQRPPEIAEAAQRSMQELMRQQGRPMPQVFTPIPATPSPPQTTPQAPEEDVPVPNNQFAKVNIESVLHDGQSSLPIPPPPRRLVPNATGPTEMVNLGVLQQGGSMASVAELPSNRPGIGPGATPLGVSYHQFQLQHQEQSQPFNFPAGRSSLAPPVGPFGSQESFQRLSPQVSGASSRLSPQLTGGLSPQLSGLSQQYTGQGGAVGTSPSPLSRPGTAQYSAPYGDHGQAQSFNYGNSGQQLSAQFSGEIYAPVQSSSLPSTSPSHLLGVPNHQQQLQQQQYLQPPQVQVHQPQHVEPAQSAQAPIRLSPMPTGAEFLSSVSHNNGGQRSTFGPSPADFHITPPPSYTRSNPYDTQSLRNQVDNLAQRPW